MPLKRKNPPTEWLRPADLAKRLGVPRTTLINRIARGDYKTKKLGGVLFVQVPQKKAAEKAA